MCPYILFILVFQVSNYWLVHIKTNILNSCPTQGRVEGWDAMKPRYFRSVSSKDAGRPRLTHHHKGWWNETKWTRWVWRNGGMKFMVGENVRNPKKNLPRPSFVHHETHMEGQRRELGTPAVWLVHLFFRNNYLKVWGKTRKPTLLKFSDNEQNYIIS